MAVSLIGSEKLFTNKLHSDWTTFPVSLSELEKLFDFSNRTGMTGSFLHFCYVVRTKLSFEHTSDALATIQLLVGTICFTTSDQGGASCSKCVEVCL